MTNHRIELSNGWIAEFANQGEFRMDAEGWNLVLHGPQGQSIQYFNDQIVLVNDDDGTQAKACLQLSEDGVYGYLSTSVGTGWVIDTPGVRSFGLSHVTTDSVLAAFDDLSELVDECPRGCKHDSTAPECALDAAVAEGRLRPERLESFRRMEKVWTSPAAWE